VSVAPNGLIKIAQFNGAMPLKFTPDWPLLPW